jgi:large subunit ribosomal protein L22
MKNSSVVSKAQVRNIRVAPRKARLVADMIRGDHAEVALRKLRFSKKKSAKLVEKLLLSAVANAREAQDVDVDTLVVKAITVDMGRTLKRHMPRAQGRATVVRKRSSHIVLELGVA